MERYMVARFLLAAFVIATVIFLIVRFAGGNDPGTSSDQSQNQSQQATVLRLSEYADRPSSSVQLIVDGKINAIESHRQIRITISQTKRTAEILGGYNGEVLERQTRSNTKEAYAALLYALDRSGFDDELPADEVRYKDPQGLCNDGNRVYYRMREGAAVLKELWTTNCSRVKGNSYAKLSHIRELFTDQFPDFYDFTDAADVNIKRL